MKIEKTEKRGLRKAKIISWLIVALFLFSTLNIMTITAVGDDVQDNGTFEDQIIAGNLTRTFLEVTGLSADVPVVHIGENTTLSLTVSSTAGSTGDDNYTSDISQAIDDIESLIEEIHHHKHVKKLLRKSIRQLEKALDDISEGQRLKSIKHIRKAIDHLEDFDDEDDEHEMDVDTENIVIDLANAVKDKVGTVIDEAESNFGSASPDVTKGKEKYTKGLDQLDDEKYKKAVKSFKKSFKKVLKAYEGDALLTVIDINPDMSETVIGELRFNNLKAENEDTGEVIWQPIERGVHYIKVSMSVEYLVYSSPAAIVEGPPVIMGVGFPVVPLAAEEWWDTPELRTIDPSDPVNNPGGIRERTGPLTIYVQFGDLTIKNSGTLILNNDVTLVMMQPGDYPITKYSVLIDPGGTFDINGGARTTNIQSTSYQLSYPFINQGTVNFDGANVFYTYGPDDTTQPGGIQNVLGGTATLSNSHLINAKTHSLYVDSSSSLTVKGTDSLIGSGVPPAAGIQTGHGIFVNGATPVIEDVTVQYNKLDGIHIENSISEGPILATDLELYSSNTYDYRMTITSGITTPKDPLVAVGNAVHNIWIEEEDIPGPFLYPIRHLMYSKSLDNGISWSDPIQLFSSSPWTYYPLTSAIASDGDYVGVVYISTSPPGIEKNVALLYSVDNGETWQGPIDLSPSGEFFAGDPSIDWQGDTAYIVYKTNPLNIVPGYEFRGIAYRTFDGAPGRIEELFYTDGYGIPQIDVDGNDIHVVFAAPNSPDPLIVPPDEAIYLHGTISPRTWDPRFTLTNYNVDGVAFSQKAFDLVAESGTVYFVWQNYDTDNYNIYYKKSADQGTSWGPDTQITFDPGNSLNPTSIIDSNMNLLVVWEDDRGGSKNLRYSSVADSGMVLPNDVPLTQVAADSINPHIAVDQTDRVYLVWEDGRDGNSEIYIKRSHQLAVNEGSIKLNSQNGIYALNINGGSIARNEIKNNNIGIQLSSTSNVQIFNNTVRSNSDDGILIRNSDYNIVESNNVSFVNNAAIEIGQFSDYNIIKFNRVFRTLRYGIQIGDNFGASTNNKIYNNTVNNTGFFGIFILNSNDAYNEVYNNTAFDNGEFGIYSRASSYNKIYNNTAYGNTYGISLRYSTHHTKVSNNTLYSNNKGQATFFTSGVAIEYNSYTNLIENNNIYGHDGTFGSGIRIDNSDSTTILNNSISGNTDGIYIRDSNIGTLVNNMIFTQLQYGVFLFTSTNIVIYHNNFLGNTVQAYDGNVNQWDNGYPSGGNYWSDWTIPDTMSGPNQDQPGSDGFVDDPKPIFGGSNLDNYPFTTQDGWL